jgi:hypothetical protein
VPGARLFQRLIGWDIRMLLLLNRRKISLAFVSAVRISTPPDPAQTLNSSPTLMWQVASKHICRAAVRRARLASKFCLHLRTSTRSQTSSYSAGSFDHSLQQLFGKGIDVSDFNSSSGLYAGS